jgi:signal transduction histidine kinase
MEGTPSIADKLARLAELENDFQRVLEAEKLEAMAEFAAGAGHEINNPLTVISGRAQLLLREETDPERQRAMALISAQAMRVHEMIADMMLFARPPRPEPQPVELVKLLDDLVADLQPRSARQETKLRRAGPSDPIVINVDPVQFNVALRAICQNALESLGSGGNIEVAVDRSSSGEVCIRISDDGPGIKPEERRHIFDPFYSARQAGRGLGFGLSKAWRIVTNHGGRIEVSSQPGHETSFVVTLSNAI